MNSLEMVNVWLVLDHALLVLFQFGQLRVQSSRHLHVDGGHTLYLLLNPGSNHIRLLRKLKPQSLIACNNTTNRTPFSKPRSAEIPKWGTHQSESLTILSRFNFIALVWTAIDMMNFMTQRYRQFLGTRPIIFLNEGHIFSNNKFTSSEY